ncbi:hypothetical protein HMPREF9086_3002 [Enterobacter hormaechei ATCC 49162]|nr:hypothetical protein HMPREF9086_3002 [Enterobacter hormaechei ATCC 49162]
MFGVALCDIVILLYGDNRHVSEKLPHFFLPQRQQLSDFSKYLSGTKPGLLVFSFVSYMQKKITDAFYIVDYSFVCSGGILPYSRYKRQYIEKPAHKFILLTG